MGTLLDQGATFAGDYVSGLLQALLALIAVAALAFVLLRSGALRGALTPRGRLLNVEETLRLDARNGLAIVRVEQRRLLLATSAEGSPRLLLELPAANEPQPAPRAAAVPPPEAPHAERSRDAAGQP
jgi:flagellar biogenesis protein FliO